MNSRDDRGEIYNANPPPEEGAESALNNGSGLDFNGRTSVNTEDLNGGPRMEPATAPVPANSLAGLEYLFKAPTAEEAATIDLAQAVIYLRVSTPRQLHTASDVEEDGNSIATQRVETLRKVREMGVTVAREFLEPGQSAQTISKRAEFKRMLRYIDDHPEVKYVVIYMRSRVFRNFTDAAITKRQLLEKGVRLVSAKEEFGEGYMADAMEAITDVMNEVQVRMNGEDVKVKMAHKVEQGGSIGRAKLGYLNVRKDYSGRLVNTIDIDPERAPLVTWAFEQYATGQYSIAQLTELLEEVGLTMRPSPSRPERPVNKSSLAKMLRDPYYTGVIRYKGRLHVGRHQAIVSKETFLKVQEILDQRNRDGDRDMVHYHYLKGMLACGQCIDDGRRSRLVYSQAKGNGGTYAYYICAARTRKLCKTTGFRVEILEDEVVKAVAGERFDPAVIDAMSDLISSTIDALLEADKEAKDALQKQLAKLVAQEDRLIDLAAGGVVDIPKLREKLEQTNLQKGAVQERLARSAERLKYGAETALAYLQMLRDPGSLYRNAPDEVRRDLLEAFFERLRVYEDESGLHLEAERNDVNQAFHDLAVRILGGHEEPVSGKAKTPRNSAGSSPEKRSLTSSLVHGLNKGTVAGREERLSNGL